MICVLTFDDSEDNKMFLGPSARVQGVRHLVATNYIGVSTAEKSK